MCARRRAARMRKQMISACSLRETIGAAASWRTAASPHQYQAQRRRIMRWNI